MSNPCINRWGLNLFWYRFWVADKNAALVVKQDDALNRLINIYVRYGLLSYRSFFLNSYWLAKAPARDTLITAQQLRYFRIVEYRNRVANETVLSKIRLKKKTLYCTKLWILRFQGWVVLNLYCFQPAKRRTRAAIKTPRVNAAYAAFAQPNRLCFLRHKLITLWQFSQFAPRASYKF